jgi:protein TonB
MNALASPGVAGTRLALALTASLIVHTLVFSTELLGVKPVKKPEHSRQLDVVLVNAKSAEAPLAPDALGQANLAGGGNTDDDVRMKSQLEASSETREGQNRRAMEQRVTALETRARALMTQLKGETAISQPKPVLNAAELNRQAQELAQQDARDTAALQARISRDWSEYQKRPKRAFVGANVKEYIFARYVEDWVAKVERIGNLNYPEAARRQGIYGSLKLTASIHADGNIEKIEIDRSSGSKILDAAAVKIVQLGAPYGQFSSEMREKIDILSITRTWTFTRTDQLTGDE